MFKVLFSSVSLIAFAATAAAQVSGAAPSPADADDGTACHSSNEIERSDDAPVTTVPGSSSQVDCDLNDAVAFPDGRLVVTPSPPDPTARLILTPAEAINASGDDQPLSPDVIIQDEPAEVGLSEQRPRSRRFPWFGQRSNDRDRETAPEQAVRPTIDPRAERGDFALFVEILKPAGENRFSVDHGMAGVVDASDGVCRSATASHFITSDAELYVSPWGSATTTARIPANVVHVSDQHDFAVIEHACALGSGHSIKFSNSNPDLRTKLFAFGQPVPQRGVVAEGIVAGYWYLMQDDGAPSMLSSLLAVEGFSGGPVYDLEGRYVGMIFGRSTSLEGYSYILPVETIRDELRRTAD